MNNHGFSKRFVWACEQDKKAPKGHKNLGKYFGVSGPMVGYWMRGEKLPGTENAISIAKKTGVSFEYLMTGRGSQYPNGASSSSGEPRERVDFQAADHSIGVMDLYVSEEDKETMGPAGLDELFNSLYNAALVDLEAGRTLDSKSEALATIVKLHR